MIISGVATSWAHSAHLSSKMESYTTREAARPLIWCIEFGFWSKCLPFAWNEAEYRVMRITGPRMLTYTQLGYCHLVRHFGMSIYILCMCKLDKSTTPADSIMAIFIVCIYITAATVHSIFLSCPETVQFVINETLFLVQTRGKNNIANTNI